MQMIVADLNRIRPVRHWLAPTRGNKAARQEQAQADRNHKPRNRRAGNHQIGKVHGSFPGQKTSAGA